MAAKKKEVAVETPKIPTNKVKLVSYTIKAVIPTGAYANIQPEIVVNASSLEEAENYVIPHINKLFGDFLNKSERRVVEPKVEVKETVVVPTEPTKITVDGEPTNMVVNETEAYKKAFNAIENAMSVDALTVIQGQLLKSVKLLGYEKDKLSVILITKIKELQK